MADVSPEVATLLETASVVGWVPSDLLCAASGLERPWEAHERALDSGLLHHRGGHVGVHDLLADWMRMRGEGESTPDVQRDRAIAIGARLEERGHLVRALEISLAFDDARSLARLLRRHGHDWVNRGHYALVADALDRLPEREVETDPALRAVAGVLAGGRHPSEAIEHLTAAVAGFREAGDRAAQFAVLSELAILAANTNRIDEVRRRAKGALRVRDLVLEPRLRGMLLQFAANGSFVRGRFVRALQLLDLADRFDHQVRERAGIGLLCAVIRFHRGEWDEVVQEVDARCADPEQRLHGPGYHAMQVWRAAVDALRGGSVEACREALDDAERMFRAAGHTLNLIYVDIVRGWVAARVSDGERAEPAIERAIETARSIRLHEIEAGAWGQLARARQRAGRLEAAREAAEHALEMLAHDKAWSSPSPRAVFWTPAIATAALVLAELGDAERAQRALLEKRRGLEHGELAPGRHTVAVVAARIAHVLGDSKTARSELELAASIRRAHPAMERAPEEDSALREWADHQAASDPPRETRSKRGEPKPKPGGAGTLASGLQIATFGGLELRLDGRILTPRDWHGQQTRRLFARLLAAEGRPVTREQLAADLWPEASARSAGGRLRVALSRLRSAIEPKRNGRATARHVQVERERVWLSSRALADWDVTRWRRALETLRDASRDADIARARESLGVLQATRRGPFLPELYDEWTLEQRRQLEERWIATTRSLAALWLQRGEPRIAAELADGLTATHRGEEEGWRLLAEARLAQGDRSGALRAIEAAREALDSELGLPLGEALTALASRLRTGDGAGAAGQSAAQRR